jgi:hypothetical protein
MLLFMARSDSDVTRQMARAAETSVSKQTRLLGQKPLDTVREHH